MLRNPSGSPRSTTANDKTIGSTGKKDTKQIKRLYIIKV